LSNCVRKLLNDTEQLVRRFAYSPDAHATVKDIVAAEFFTGFCAELSAEPQHMSPGSYQR